MTSEDKETIFDKTKVGSSTEGQAGAQAGTEDQGTENKPFLKVGERVFSDPDEVVTKLVNQDSHISQIEKENAELRRQLESAAKVEDLMEQMQSRMASSSTGNSDEQQTAGLDENTVQELVVNVLQKTEAQKQREQNLKACDEESIEVFGDAASAADAVATRAAELGLNADQVKEMASTNPVLYRETFLRGQSSGTTGAAHSMSGTSNVNANAHDNVSTKLKEGTYSWYMQKIKEDPRNSYVYENEIVKRVQEQGPGYFDT